CHDVGNQDFAAAARRVERGPSSGCPLGKVERTQQARIAVYRADELALVPDMIAGGDAVDTRRIEFMAQLLGNAIAARRVLAVDDDEVQGELAPQLRYVCHYRLAARAAHHVAAEQNAHRALSIPASRDPARRGGVRRRCRSTAGNP